MMDSFDERIATIQDLSDEGYGRQMRKQNVERNFNHDTTTAGGNLPPEESLGTNSWLLMAQDQFSWIGTLFSTCWEWIPLPQMSDYAVCQVSILLLGFHHVGQTLLPLIPTFPTATHLLGCSPLEALVCYWSLWAIPCAAAISLLIEHQWGQHQVVYYEGAIVVALIIVCCMDCMDEYYDDGDMEAVSD